MPRPAPAAAGIAFPNLETGDGDRNGKQCECTHVPWIHMRPGPEGSCSAAGHGHGAFRRHWAASLASGQPCAWYVQGMHRLSVHTELNANAVGWVVGWLVSGSQL